MLTLSTGDVVAIVFALVSLVIGVAAFLRSHPNATPTALDAYVTARLDQIQADPEQMDRLERAYADGSAAQKHALEVVADILKAVAPYTPIKADDAAAALLEDMETLGEPAQPAPPTPSANGAYNAPGYVPTPPVK